MKCCSCNSSGRCVQCSCVRASRRCYNCVPSLHNRCNNAVLPRDHGQLAVGSQPTSQPTSHRRLSLPGSLPALVPPSSSSSLLLSSSQGKTVSVTPGIGRRAGAGKKVPSKKVKSPGVSVSESVELSLSNTAKVGSTGASLAPVSSGVQTAHATSPKAAIGRRADQADHDTAAPHASCYPESNDERPGDMPDLPTYTSANGVTFSWGDVNGPDFRQAINAAYAEVTHWRRNVFLVPSGEAGKEFVLELARLFRTYAESSALESIALTAAMVLPTLLLQKLMSNPKPKTMCFAWDEECSFGKTETSTN